MGGLGGHISQDDLEWLQREGASVLGGTRTLEEIFGGSKSAPKHPARKNIKVVPKNGGLWLKYYEGSFVIYKVFVRNGKITQIIDADNFTGDTHLFLAKKDSLNDEPHYYGQQMNSIEGTPFPTAQHAMAFLLEKAPDFYKTVREYCPTLWTFGQARNFIIRQKRHKIDEQIALLMRQVQRLKRERRQL